ncbi:STAS domain-containing protein [Pelagicoccus enzymogenes]|uniref:STAS domain-containing protein n=1 Tax=Pelagicoccus enzymogenes TaxID=2773457 RepID=UPI00280D386E|nr:STAS domain-containing protein [Pelagicoccus enzymogenes]MDQ8200257.1 STAS domain-containing protein [Pelagicoccus enzymogenes]
MKYEIERTEAGSKIRLSGVVNIESAAELAEKLREALRDSPCGCELSVGDGITIDAAALQVLLAARRNDPALELVANGESWSRQMMRYGCNWNANTKN